MNKPTDLDIRPRRRASFEGMVIEEVAALAREASSRSNVFFWRTEAGSEVDLIVTVGRHVVPIEIKLGAAIDHHSVRGLRQCMADLGPKNGWVISGGAEPSKLGHDIEIVPWADVVHRRCDFGIARAAR